MPIITISLVEGRTAERKAALLREVTEAVARVLEAPRESIRVLLAEIPATHWAVGGVALSETRLAPQADAEP
jgi:4-oxalocrotonate tautomerase